MSSRWLLALLLVPLLSSIAYSQKLINGFTRELAIHGLPVGFSLKSFDVTGDSVSELFVITSSQLWAFDGKAFSMIFKDSVAPGTANLSPADVNRDGSMDLVANSKDTAVIVWYGPDFSIRSLFPAPRRGFGAFAVRNREDGQVEFTFGRQHRDSTVTCYPIPPRCIVEPIIDGIIFRYVDTTFASTDSIQIDLDPFSLLWKMPGPGQSGLFLFGYYRKSACYCPGPIDYLNLRVKRLDGQQILPLIDYSVVFNWEVYCGSMPVLRAYTIGNIDGDSSSEIVAFADPSFINGVTCRRAVSFGTYDVLSGQQQWVRTDTLGILSLFTVDLNGDGVQELVSYEIQSSVPGLVEYNTSDGSTLGFTGLPFTPSTILTGLFGDPLVPKVLLGDGDSVVVYRVGCSANKGDMNADGNVTIFDITLGLNCAFLGEGNCDLCFADVNCDAILSTSDVVLELLAVFQQRPFPCS